MESVTNVFFSTCNINTGYKSYTRLRFNKIFFSVFFQSSSLVFPSKRLFLISVIDCPAPGPKTGSTWLCVFSCRQRTSGSQKGVDRGLFELLGENEVLSF